MLPLFRNRKLHRTGNFSGRLDNWCCDAVKPTRQHNSRVHDEQLQAVTFEIMKLLDLTLKAAAANLALDEALLELADQAAGHPEVLRLWEPETNMVVLGRSSPIEQEVNLDFCRQHQISVFRRCSGGASIVTGPGCLMYAVLLDYRKHEPLRMLEKAHFFVMENMRLAISRLGVDVELAGHFGFDMARP